MKDYVNPFLLLVVVGLMACQASAETEPAAARLSVWILTLCVTGFVVDGALALARAMAHRPSLMSVVWAVVYLVLGSCTWVMHSGPLTEEQSAYRQQQQTVSDPLARDAEGETLLSRAAALGKVDEVRRILNSATPSDLLINEAGLRAAENNHSAVLEELARLGMHSTVSVDGVPLLHAAAQNGACEAMAWLISRGAQVNARDAEGSTPLIQAAASGSVSAVKLLLQHGADLHMRDTSGRSAVDFARSEEMESLLTPPRN